MNFVADLHKGVIERDLAKLKSAYSKSLKGAGPWTELHELYTQFDSLEADNNIFYLLYQDLKLRRATPQKSWSEKLALYHNFCCLIEELINTDFKLPADWFWEILAAMVNSYVTCTNEKWSLLKSSTNLSTLEPSELQTFRDLYDFDVVEGLLLRLIEKLGGSVNKQSDKENISSNRAGEIEALDEINHNVAQIALIKLYGALNLPFQELLSGVRSENLPIGARSILNYAQLIGAMQDGIFVPNAKDSSKFSKTLSAFCECLNDSSAYPDARDLLRASLRPMCSKCNFREDCVQVDVKEQLVERIWRKFLAQREKETFLAYARIYRSVTLEMLSELSGCRDLDAIRSALCSDPQVSITGNVVHVTYACKQESYTDILRKQTSRAKELMALLNKL